MTSTKTWKDATRYERFRMEQLEAERVNEPSRAVDTAEYGTWDFLRPYRQE